ncbi:MAG: hypothetical protein WKF84_03385 [Pyrinomonadaceae bacterium]
MRCRQQTNGHYPARGPFSMVAPRAMRWWSPSAHLASGPLFVAVEIDRAMIPEIVGTLAGEDTVFVAVAEKKAQRVAIKKIWELFVTKGSEVTGAQVTRRVDARRVFERSQCCLRRRLSAQSTCRALHKI